MRTSRRELLASLAAGLAVGTGAGCKTGEDLEPLPWAPGGTEDLEAFPYGLQAGDPTDASVVLSVRTDEPEVRFQVVRISEDGWKEVASETATTEEGFVQREIGGLEPGYRYEWTVWAGASERRSIVGAFRSAPEGQPVFRFGAVSCLGGNRPWPTLTRAAESGLDLFLLLGDTIYADWGPAVSYRRKWDEALEQDGFVALSASTGLVATWDDHEVWNNWDPEDPDDASDAERALVQFRAAIPQRVGPTGGIWRSLKWGETAELFVLDCRSERIGGDYISRAQMDWLKEGLSASTARFKIILNSVPITDFSAIPVYGSVGAEDRWQGHPAQRTELVEHCAGIPGVLFVSGDFHVGGAMDIDPPGGPGEAIPEVLAGPGGSPVDDLYSLVPTGGFVLAVVTELNHARLECHPDTGVVDVTWVDDDGNAIRTIRLELS